MSYLIFARKYRPQTFEEVVGQKATVQTLQNAIKNNRIAQAYIFSGMRGVGKTTVARILAKALNCEHGPTPDPCNSCEFCLSIKEDRSIDVLEIDGASNRGVEEISAIRDVGKYKPIYTRYKIIIIDEVHMLTTHAFNALLKTLEEPPPRTVFIFATTEFHKVPATIVSRCQHFEFKKIPQKEIVHHLEKIAQEEKISISPHGLNLIAEAAEGSLRDAQSLLDKAVSFCGETIADKDLKEILGAVSKELLFEFSSAIMEGKASQIFSLVDRVIENGYDLRYFYKELVQHFRNLLLVSSLQEPRPFLSLTPEELSRMFEESKKVSDEEILRYIVALQQGEQGMRYSSHPQIYLEILLIKLCHFKKIVSLKDLLLGLEEMRKGETQRIETQGIEKRETKSAENIPGEALEKEIQPSLSRPGKERENKREKEIAAALKDSHVQYFMDTFKAQILSIELPKSSKEKD